MLIVDSQVHIWGANTPQRPWPKRAAPHSEVPLGRLASLQDIAEAAVYLASQEGAFINGIALSVDGGVTAY